MRRRGAREARRHGGSRLASPASPPAPAQEWRTADATFSHHVAVSDASFTYEKRCLRWFDREHGSAGYDEQSARLPLDAAFTDEEAWASIATAFGATLASEMEQAVHARCPGVRGERPRVAPPGAGAPWPPGASSPAPAGARAWAQRVRAASGTLAGSALLVAFVCGLGWGGAFFAGLALDDARKVWRARIADAYQPIVARVVDRRDRGLVEHRAGRTGRLRRREGVVLVRYTSGGAEREHLFTVTVPDVVRADALMEARLAAFTPGREVTLLVDEGAPDAPLLDAADLPGVSHLLSALVAAVLCAALWCMPAAAAWLLLGGPLLDGLRRRAR